MKKYIKILLVLIMFTALPVFALTDTLYKTDDSVSVSDDFNGSAFVAGNDVEIDSTVDGILFSAGNIVNQSGESEYLFTSGNVVKVNSQKSRDAFIAGYNVSVNDSTFERDAYVAGETVRFDSKAGRNVYLVGNKVFVSGTVEGNVTIYASEIVVKDNTVIKGVLKYSSDSKTNISKTAVIGSIKKEKNNNIGVKVDSKATFASVLMGKVFSFANALLIAVIMLLLFPKLYEKIAKQDKNTILKNLGYGALTLFVVPIAAMIIMITMVGLSTGLILLDLFIVCAYLSTIFTSYYFSNMILGNKIKNRLLVLLIGLLVIYVLDLIPFISILVSISSLCIGLGLVINMIFNRK